MKSLLFHVALLLALFLIRPANAAECEFVDTRVICAGTAHAPTVHVNARRVHEGQRSLPGCPRYLGCGCNLAVLLGFGPRRDLWLARNWLHEGRPAAPGCVKCVVIFRRGRRGGHVGLVIGYDANGNPNVRSYANPRLGWTVDVYPSSRVLGYRYVG